MCSALQTQKNQRSQVHPSHFPRKSYLIFLELLNQENNFEVFFNSEPEMQHPYGCYANYLSHFAFQLAQNTTQNSQFQANIVQGLQTYVIIEAIRRSAMKNQVVSIKDIKNEVYADATEAQ